MPRILRKRGQDSVAFVSTVFLCIFSMQYLLKKYSTSFRNCVKEMVLQMTRKEIFFLKAHLTSVGIFGSLFFNFLQD